MMENKRFQTLTRRRFLSSAVLAGAGVLLQAVAPLPPILPGLSESPTAPNVLGIKAVESVLPQSDMSTEALTSVIPIQTEYNEEPLNLALKNVPQAAFWPIPAVQVAATKYNRTPNVQTWTAGGNQEFHFSYNNSTWRYAFADKDVTGVGIYDCIDDPQNKMRLIAGLKGTGGNNLVVYQADKTTGTLTPIKNYTGVQAVGQVYLDQKYRQNNAWVITRGTLPNSTSQWKTTFDLSVNLAVADNTGYEYAIDHTSVLYHDPFGWNDFQVDGLVNAVKQVNMSDYGIRDSVEYEPIPGGWGNPRALAVLEGENQNIILVLTDTGICKVAMSLDHLKALSCNRIKSSDNNYARPILLMQAKESTLVVAVNNNQFVKADGFDNLRLTGQYNSGRAFQPNSISMGNGFVVVGSDQGMLVINDVDFNNPDFFIPFQGYLPTILRQ